MLVLVISAWQASSTLWGTVPAKHTYQPADPTEASSAPVIPTGRLPRYDFLLDILLRAQTDTGCRRFRVLGWWYHEMPRKAVNTYKEL